VSGQAKASLLKATASSRGGVGSNWKRTGGQQGTNSIRRGTTTSWQGKGEVWNTPGTLAVLAYSDVRAIHVIGAGAPVSVVRELRTPAGQV
jgi:hypothetical protein